MAIIKTCPFCGAQPRFTIYDMGYGNGCGYPGKHKIEIRCSYSFCGVRPSLSVDDVYIKTEEAIEECVAIWNRRANEESEV